MIDALTGGEDATPRIASTTGVVPVVADAEGRMLGGRREGLDTIYDQVKVPVARDKARPTPDEARRMINELIGSMAVVGNGLDDSPGAVVAKRIAADARKALLRALGVEA